MFTPRTPVYLSHSPTPGVKDFALLAALEAGIRGMLLSVMPLVMYRAYLDAALVSRIYLIVGIVSLVTGMMAPWINRFVPRRWMFTAAGVLYICGLGFALTGVPELKAATLLCNAMGTVTFTVCFNAYVLDYIARQDLGRNESMRMVYSGASWAIGPFLGVTLLNWWEPAPFLVAMVFAFALVAVFWWLRLGNGKQISRAKGPAPNPVAFLGRFVAQPRLIVGWTFAVIRSCGWWAFVVYMPIYCIENGLGEKVGAIATSGANTLLFLTPQMLKIVHRVGVRRAVRSTFAICGGLFIAGWLAAPLPWLTYGVLIFTALFLVMLDVCGSLPFLMAVKPSERTEMAAVYSSFRDVSGIMTPGLAWVVLLFTPVQGIFAVVGIAMWGAWALAGTLHPRLGFPHQPASVTD